MTALLLTLAALAGEPRVIATGWNKPTARRLARDAAADDGRAEFRGFEASVGAECGGRQGFRDRRRRPGFGPLFREHGV